MFFFDNLFNAVFGENPKVWCTGVWRKDSELVNKLDWELNGWGGYLVKRWDVEVLTQEKEAKQQALSAFHHMRYATYISQNLHRPRSLALFIGAGRGSSQFTLVDRDGHIVDWKSGPGYPKDGPKPTEELTALMGELESTYGSRIKLIVGFDSIYHLCKESCPVVPDKGTLPVTVTTKGRDFRVGLGFIPDAYLDTPMVVVRNFKYNMNLRNSSMSIRDCDVLRKITFICGDRPEFDVGSGKLSLVDPSTGAPMAHFEYPDDWKENDVAFREILDYMVGASMHGVAR